MEGRVIVACLFLVAVVRGEQAPTGLCRANERFLECGGCQKTCSDPAPTNCAAVCRTGCYCEEGQVRSASGLCVDLSACPPIKAAYKQDTSEPRPNGGRCPENEEYRFCEPCNRTCDNRNPICPAQCTRGCFCKTGLLRDRNGSCVTPEKCSSILPAVPAPTVLPAVPAPTVLPAVPAPTVLPAVPAPTVLPAVPAPTVLPAVPAPTVLPAVPAPTVLPAVPAPTVLPAVPAPTVPAPNATKHEMVCGDHQVFKQCQTQVKTCGDPYGQVPSPCLVACYCTEGYVKAPNGQCVRLEDCPKPKGNKNNEKIENKANNTQTRNILQEGVPPTLVQVHPMFGEVIMDSQPSHHEPSVEHCAPNEEYFTCGWCEPSCSDPSPICPNKVCTRGCLCRPPLLRRLSGQCVDWKDCYPQRCSNPNEEYVCLFGCEPRCDGVCQQPPFCELGCYCRLGLLRDNNGLCVIKERCSNSTEVRAVKYDRSTAVNYNKSPSVNQPRDTTVDLETILGYDKTFILVPIM